MDSDQWLQQGIAVVKEEQSGARPQLQTERRARPHKEQALSCPRCNSTNTKFCYYNNYSLNQPRYFCKTCRRYWTEGGSLRNVPVGGGSRKNKRPSSSTFSPSASSLTSSTTTAATTATSLVSELDHAPQMPLGASNFYQGGKDLNLSFPNQNMGHEFGGFPSSSSSSLSAMELLRSGMGLGPFVPGPGSGFGFHELVRPDLKLPLGGSMQEGGAGRLLLPFEDLKQVSMGHASREERNGSVQGQGEPNFFWNASMGNGSCSGDGGGGSW
ncbi:hypothetical protein HPP92_002156 [Vanilla planifolia]|uniref:Dof zinc finger protein n=1 Tax=Vanilla planifolia TaxID=51239 RepID=A0A835S127_VANPL|nr:hypothetical protein HPP92_002156 [Vanilla planifolia]